MNSESKASKGKRKVDSHTLSLEGFIRDKNDDDDVTKLTQVKKSNMQAAEQIGDNRLLAEEIKKIHKEIAQLREEVKYIRSAEKSKGSAPFVGVYYRKNKRVVYIPKKPLYEKVLERLKRHVDEPVSVTLKRVFEAAAKHLGVDIEHEQ